MSQKQRRSLYWNSIEAHAPGFPDPGQTEEYDLSSPQHFHILQSQRGRQRCERHFINLVIEMSITLSTVNSWKYLPQNIHTI